MATTLQINIGKGKLATEYLLKQATERDIHIVLIQEPHSTTEHKNYITYRNSTKSKTTILIHKKYNNKVIMRWDLTDDNLTTIQFNQGPTIINLYNEPGDDKCRDLTNSETKYRK